ncbi:hypothetical protein OO17_14055 [Rhodopseudomonas palustris]|uniref:Uncharacterized protein n=2 Tax=Nitrobacteraceae TaxID=41294 RepID=A0A0D7EM05_RHOPL|nr:hypothetical protein OO17_14055 [Rhodopseudomonas palustris]
MADFRFTSPGNAAPRIGSHPIAIAAATLILIIVGIVAVMVWRNANGGLPEQERITKAQLIQARVVQVSEEMRAKAKGLEQAQQQSIDQLQVMQDQLKELRQALAAERTKTKQLSDEVVSLTETLDGLRQSFASTQASEAKPALRRKPAARQSRSHGTKSRSGAAAQKRGKPRS